MQLSIINLFICGITLTTQMIKYGYAYTCVLVHVRNRICNININIKFYIIYKFFYIISNFIYQIDIMY
jgi:hypothetical protein